MQKIAPTLAHCPVCQNTDFRNTFYSDRLPKYNLTYTNTRQAAMDIERVSVNFVHCRQCDFVFNNIYTQLDYKETSYDASRVQSKVIVDYYQSVLMAVLPHIGDVERVVEVGAGDCYFSELVKAKTGASVTAYDPTFSETGLIRGVYRNRVYYDQRAKEEPDLVYFRHVLEHISNVRSFLESVLHESPENVFIEIPCAEFVAKNNWHYFSNEHCSYFSEYSLVHLLGQYRYHCVFIDKVFNDENIIAVFTRSRNGANSDSAHLAHSTFSPQASFDDWKSAILNRMPSKGLVWGAGGKGVTSLNLLDIPESQIAGVVDINHNIWGKFMPGTGIEIVSPEQAINSFPDSDIFVMNTLYKNEIALTAKKLGHKGRIKLLF